jgi:large subunit ribosomal protein L33
VADALSLSHAPRARAPLARRAVHPAPASARGAFAAARASARVRRRALGHLLPSPAHRAAWRRCARARARDRGASARLRRLAAAAAPGSAVLRAPRADATCGSTSPPPLCQGKTVLIKLLSSANTGYFYAARKNPTTIAHKLAFMKYDPIVRQHVLL